MGYRASELTRFWEQHDERLEACFSSPFMSLEHNLYRHIPAGFNIFFDFAQRLAIRPLLAAGCPRPWEVVLDLGCGTGRWAGTCRGYGLRTVGVDIGLRALRTARYLTGGGEWVRNLLPYLSFRPSCFDWVISVAVLQHLIYEDQVTCVSEVYRILKPGGRFIVLELTDQGDRAPHVFPRSRSDWEVLFKDAGFTIVARRSCERIPWVGVFRRLRQVFSSGWSGELRPGARWLSLTAPVFVPVAVLVELMATAVNLERWARYTGWLLARK